LILLFILKSKTAFYIRTLLLYRTSFYIATVFFILSAPCHSESRLSEMKNLGFAYLEMLRFIQHDRPAMLKI